MPSTVSRILEKAGGGKYNVDDIVQMSPFTVNGGPLIWAFPRELRSEKGYPFVAFSVPQKNDHIYLPIPPALTFSDSAAYSSLNLGILGSVAAETISAARNSPGSAAKVINAAASQMGRSIGSRASSLNAAAAASIFAREAVKAEGIANVIDFSNRQVIAPNTNTTFSNVNIRSFGFSFKMVAKDKKDSDIIADIVRTFRMYLYPEGDQLILKYPPVWSIRFYNGLDESAGDLNRSRETEEMEYLPKIGLCYLTSFSSTYNASTNIFHKDGSPTEVDVNMTFQETKAYHRGEMDKIQGSRRGPPAQEP